MVVLDIHLEDINKEDFRDHDQTRILKEILDKDLPVAISLPPFLEDYWLSTNPEVIELVKEAIAREKNVLGQQGNQHKCKHKHNFADPWHENYCIWNGKLSSEEQKDLMKRGRERLEKLIGQTPELYVPPNHYHDKVTIEIAESMGYHFFADNAMIPISPYKHGKVLIVPECSLKRKNINSNIVYIHYDEIDSIDEKYRGLISHITPMRDLPSSEVPNWLRSINSSLKYAYKIWRDMRRFASLLTKPSSS